MSDYTEELRALKARIEVLEALSSPERLMTALEVVAYVGISERQFYDHKAHGEGPPQINFSDRTVRYKRADVDAWLESKRVGAGN